MRSSGYVGWLFVASAFSSTSAVADITVEGSFGSGGTATVALVPNYNSGVADIAIDANGKIVMVGTTAVPPVFGQSTNEMFVIRLNANGTPDSSFSGDGQLIMPSPLCQPPPGSGGTSAQGVAIQPNGRIVVAASCHSAPNSRITVFRFLADGTLDSSFGAGGVSEQFGPAGTNGTSAAAVSLQSDGRIVVAGKYGANTFPAAGLVLRLNTDGTLDTSFGTNGIFRSTLPATDSVYAALRVMPDDRIVAGGYITATGISPSNYNFFLTRLTAAGAPDATFAGGGYKNFDLPTLTSAPSLPHPTQDFVTGVTLRADGTVIAAGNVSATGSSDRFGVLVQVTPTGDLDAAFGEGGFRTLTDGGADDLAFNAYVRAGGDLVVTGSMRPVQLSANGSAVFPFLNRSQIGTGELLADGSLIVGLSPSLGTVGAQHWLLTDVSTPPDTTPDAFSFAAATNAPLSSVRTSGTATVSGINALASISVVGGEYSIGCSGTWLSPNEPRNIANGATVCLRHTSSPNPLSVVTTTLTIGNVMGSFSSTTGNSNPDPFAFPHQTGVPTSTVVVSAPVTISGITIDAIVSVSGGEMSIGCGAVYTTAPSTIANGQTVCVRHTSSASAGTPVTTMLTVGSTSGFFTSTTATAGGAGPGNGGGGNGGGGGGSVDGELLALLAGLLLFRRARARRLITRRLHRRAAR